MRTDATGDSPADSPVPSVGEVVSPPSRGHTQANDITIRVAPQKVSPGALPQKGHFREFAFSSTPEIVREHGDVAIAVGYEPRGG